MADNTLPLSYDTHQRLGLEARQPWRDHALCKGRPDLIKGGEGQDERKRLCFRCPVITHCRTWALNLPPGGDTSDIAGGLTAKQRNAERIRAGQRRTAARMNAHQED